MPTLTTEVANAVMTRKDGHMPRFTMARSKPFVVSNVSTKRYAPSMAKRTPVQKLLPTPPPTSTKERLSVPRGVRPSSLPTVVPKAEPHRTSPKPMPMPAPNMTPRVQKSLPLPLVLSADRSLREKAFVHKPLKIVQRLKDGTGTPTRNRRLTAPKPIPYPQAVKSTSHAAWSPSASPDLSSFPSQSWMIAVDVDIERVETPTTICGDETLSSMGDAPKSPSSSLTVVQTLASPAEPAVGSDGMSKISSPTKGPSAEVSHTVCAATIISPSRNGTTSMATLAKVMDKSQASSPTQVSDTENRTLMAVRCAIEITRTLFSPSRRASQSSTEAADPKTMGTNVSRIRKPFIPPLDKDVRVMTQIEIGMLRAQKKVAGGGVVDPRLDRLGSLTATEIVTKWLETSGSDSARQVWSVEMCRAGVVGSVVRS